MSGSFATADNAKGAVLVIHENRGLTDHIKAVGGRLAGDGYTTLAPDLLSRAGGTGSVAADARRPRRDQHAGPGHRHPQPRSTS